MIGKIIGIKRLNIDTDGHGVTTLVGLYACPLNCEYCINNPVEYYYKLTVEQLYEQVVIDDIYFEHSGGGICFGGHEPLLQQDFIIEFIQYVRSKGHNWHFTLETSLNVSSIKEELLQNISHIIADIKTMNNDKYIAYTEISNINVKKNLIQLKTWPGEMIIVIPTIPNYITKNDVAESKQEVLNIGYREEQIDSSFLYITKLETS